MQSSAPSASLNISHSKQPPRSRGYLHAKPATEAHAKQRTSASPHQLPAHASLENLWAGKLQWCRCCKASGKRPPRKASVKASVRARPAVALSAKHRHSLDLEPATKFWAKLSCPVQRLLDLLKSYKPHSKQLEKSRETRLYFEACDCCGESQH